MASDGLLSFGGIGMTPTSSRIRVLSVDDHAMIREGVAGAVNAQPDMELVGEARDGQEAIEAYRRYHPDITLLDLRMPIMNGAEALKVIRGEFPGARIIVLTTYDGDVQAVRALRAGAQGYLLKSMLRKDLLDTIRLVHAGRRCIPPEIAERMAKYFDQSSLTDRETDVLRLVASGHSNKITAQRLSISEDTVKNHMSSILSKLGANDRTHAVTIALKRGFLEG
ncbi:Response regulators consisting of a CheY-like receiver domain and a HTH DNA-binding domain [Acidisarcina polymorpha]|uniref:Response regulators consisting of a CheY-like receiver domain and a HTH DNA-binding domain n=1 Tax=Acidisarcina polymorpha TaxID=2211140 RepID=A0A2Z5FSA2_9BACT|nr:response regulator transcription factor [Acidisarcina polymorpha]AXC09681.1 Response regulators consisting of a CheY-like receiver domain and a HTH DNA-binding domain [Acidisarcina polymorpha]